MTLSILAKLQKFFKDASTEPDGSTFCPVRILAALAIVIYHIAASIGVATNSIHIDMAALHDYVRQMIEFVGTTAASVGAKSLMRADAPLNPPPGQ
jgi:uncharacterized integral membrane protein